MRVNRVLENIYAPVNAGPSPHYFLELSQKLVYPGLQLQKNIESHSTNETIEIWKQ